jgi:hypothetical protein
MGAIGRPRPILRPRMMRAWLRMTGWIGKRLFLTAHRKKLYAVCHHMSFFT